MSPDVNDPAYRAVTYKDLFAAYEEQITALVESGVDIILFETTFDTLNAKAGLEAAATVLEKKGKSLPVMLSLTLSAQGGRYRLGRVELFLRGRRYETLLAGVGPIRPFLHQRLSQRRIAQ